MLESTIQALASGRVILASGSPRRHDIMRYLRINADIVPSLYDENLDRSKYNNHWEYVQDIAKYKVLEVYERLKADSVPPSLIIGADTMVTMGDTIYGKPQNEAEAFQMLSSLANKQHVVYTGVCLKTPKSQIQFYESAKVKFGDISEKQIREYIKTGDSMDKAGGYGLQGMGGCLIEKIDGDYYTITGLPLYSLSRRLNQMFSSV
ncbi:PREDICTED: maf-like protein CTC_02076 [Dinoponera quadriceps]|uniref:Maf-like protein CTC_02076 n=1 Tax=Dinoponera quadriceps TaxID=609295 RepID=A0A6P3X6F7_DINQU|nr:PREDICTED: maf-like protein CTC_02076 [Dinoponera quadriceps]XP_014473836.1 PREDICTED: maf-like protein CTC_02076 [Dinoponera quadriceps]XP_014473837.1 PREDICTED: maf-like protein CTC_02076 [Dinoponera quadriceps]